MIVYLSCEISGHLVMDTIICITQPRSQEIVQQRLLLRSDVAAAGCNFSRTAALHVTARAQFVPALGELFNSRSPTEEFHRGVPRSNSTEFHGLPRSCTEFHGIPRSSLVPFYGSLFHI